MRDPGLPPGALRETFPGFAQAPFVNLVLVRQKFATASSAPLSSWNGCLLIPS